MEPGLFSNVSCSPSRSAEPRTAGVDAEAVSKARSAPRSESSEVLVAATRRIWPSDWTKAGERP